MSGKELARQVIALPEREREVFLAELLDHEEIGEDLEDLLLVQARRDEPTVPFETVVEGLKRDRLL